MSNIRKDSPISPQQPAHQPPSDETDITKRMEKDADEMADGARKSEKRYDENHDIFTK